MATGPITSENYREAVMDMLASRSLELLVGNLRMPALVNRDYEERIATAGETISIAIPPVRSARNLAEDGDVQFTNSDPGYAKVTLDNHVYDGFRITDMAKILRDAANDDMKSMDDQIGPAVVAIAERIETDLFSLYAQLTTQTGSTGAAISEDAIDDAETALFKAKVPAGLTRYLAMHADPYQTARNLPRFSEMDKIGSGNAIVTGDVGRLKGFETFRSQYAIKDGSNVYHSIAFTRDAFALVFRDLPPVETAGAIVRRINYNGIGMRLRCQRRHQQETSLSVVSLRLRGRNRAVGVGVYGSKWQLPGAREIPNPGGQ